MSSELDLLKQENAKLVAENASLLAKEAGFIARIVELEQTAKENAELKAKVAKLEQTAEENAELKARVAKLEQKQLQNDISSNTGSSNSSFISPEDKEVDDFVDLKVKEKIRNDQSHVILTESPSLQTEVSKLEQDDEIDKNQIVEQGLIQELHLPTKENDNSKIRARKLLMLFGKDGVGIDKIKQVTYSANEISKLTNVQIQSVINQVTLKTVPSGNDQTNAEVSALSNARSAHTSVSSNSAHNRDYFRNKILGRYPDIYREFSSEKFDCYGAIDKSLCPACKLSHKDEKSIRGKNEAGSYFINKKLK
ncbi:3047_t:CDS:2 [Paraglomus brasilianum]|uniref:3047_t:CDS:1 n=1 Tax=Paraglomus brasilianum TaxID=144538 RepID=A0A9N9CB43_9GLOM|nr:3047_t:CDS:2 [Paraglomus brasilianum]